MSREGGIGTRIKKLFAPRRALPLDNTTSADYSEVRAVITAEHIRDISRSNVSNSRERAILELTQTVALSRLQPNEPEALVKAVEDLLDSSQERSKRHLVLNFMHAVIRGQGESLGMLREYIFFLIQGSPDVEVCLDIMNTLTNRGQNLTYIDQQVGDLLLTWSKKFYHSDRKADFLDLLVNIIKKNAAFIDEDKAMELFNFSCSICNCTTSRDEIERCLQVMESVLRYYYLRAASLLPFCTTLCRTVLHETFYQLSWKLMKDLLRTHLGPCAIFTLTDLLQLRDAPADETLLRGAIFFIGMALWGTQRCDDLHISASAVLPAFKTALRCQDLRIGFEVSITVLRLVRKYGKSQPSILWSHVLDILDTLYTMVQKPAAGEGMSILQKISNNMHDILTAMEDLQDSCTYSSSPDRLFLFIERCATNRPENSVAMLLEHRAEACKPPEEKWFENLTNLLTKYYRNESRPAIRIRAIHVLEQILSTNRIMFEDQLLELVQQHFANIHTEPDLELRRTATNLLVQQAKTCITGRCVEMISLLQKIVNREIEPNLRSACRLSDPESHCADISAAVNGLAEIFKIKLAEPGSRQVLLVLKILISHVRSHYRPIVYSQTASQIRTVIFTLLLDLKADQSGRVGCSGSGSSFLYCSDMYLPSEKATHEELSTDPSSLDVDLVLECVDDCLREELDWQVLSQVLEKMPKQWQNKTFILAADSQWVDKICCTLCAMLSGKQLRKLYNTPPDFRKLDFDSAIFPVLTCMSAYHSCLLSARTSLIRCLEFGLVTKCAKICVHTLRVCCMEMESVMIKMLPNTLVTLSKIVAQRNMAQPLLMFLSCLVRLPKLYKNFNEDQYRLIFAIALPYTDPFRFTHFAVYLAYHVIVMWFVKCRLMYRKHFVQYIIKGLQTIMKQFQNRSSSELNQAAKDNLCEIDRLLAFHQELQETCIDFLARYAFSTCASVPKRSPVSEFLLEGGRSQTWFIGNKLVTITTSGGGTKVTKSGLCHRCTASARGEGAIDSTVAADSEEPSTGRRRHRTHGGQSVLEPTSSSVTGFAKDDLDVFPKMRTVNEDSGSTGGDLTGDLMTSLSSRGGLRFNPGDCNCWCNGWAEVYIRRPSGNVSWILRIQNLQLLDYEDFPLSDISALYMPSPLKSPFSHPAPAVSMQLESGSLEDVDYEEHHAQHFQHTGARRRIPLDDDVHPPEGIIPRNGSNPEMSITEPHKFPMLPSRNTVLFDTSAHSRTHGAFTARQTSHVEDRRESDSEEDVLAPMPKTRSHTISYTSTSSSPDGPPWRLHTARDTRQGISPSFVFLQLYHNGSLHVSNAPIPVTDHMETYDRSLKNLDRIPPYETHKVGVLYVGRGQSHDETAILANTFGSRRYSEFLKRLGNLLSLRDCDSEHMFIGGLDTNGDDGQYTYTWHDEVVQMVFHIATLMPTKETDKKCNNKKRHIGNDYVTVVYNDSSEEYTMGTIKGQFNYVNIIIEPLDQVSNAVSLQCKDDISGVMGHVATKVITDENVASLIKQISLHASMASLICERQKNKELYASNWLERLRHIKRMKEKIARKPSEGEEKEGVVDFTAYV